MPVTVQTYTYGAPIPSPCYLDANVLTSYFVNRAKTPRAKALVGAILIEGVATTVSTLTISELWWAIFEELWNEYRAHSGPYERMNRGIYQANKGMLLNIYRREINAIRQSLATWPRLQVVPADLSGWQSSLSHFDRLVDSYNLTPSDALHLSLALTHAQSFFTEDAQDFGDFADPQGNLIIYLF